jgi:CMP-N,N'-diacetyllegionaminic acid synthase
MNNIVCLIPARGGSKRIPRKNIKMFGHHPLIAYTIEVANQSGIFDDVYVSTDDAAIADIAAYYEAKVIDRPEEYSRDDSPDIEWIKHALWAIGGQNIGYFFILRPTNPFRTTEMLVRAWDEYDWGKWLKAVEPVEQHPNKMWAVGLTGMKPFVGDRHALPSNVLSPIHVQNGSLEIRKSNFWDDEVIEYQPFITVDHEGFDLNTERDWIYAEWLMRMGKAEPIKVRRPPYGMFTV